MPGRRKGILVRSGVGWKPGVVGHARVGNDVQSPAGYAFRTGEPVLSNDLESEPRFRTPSLLAEHGIRSAINVLIRTDGHAVGVLEVDSTNRGEFANSDGAFLQTLATTLVPKVITMAAKAGSEGKLFGSVTASDIAAAVEEQTNVVIDRRKIVLHEPIKTLGTHTVPVKLHADVEFPVTLDVVAE